MKIDYVSDLHINHWIPWNNNQIKWEKRTREIIRRLISNGNGEVLIIAGDFTEWNQQTLWVLDEVAKQYERFTSHMVIMIFIYSVRISNENIPIHWEE